MQLVYYFLSVKMKIIEENKKTEFSAMSQLLASNQTITKTDNPTIAEKLVLIVFLYNSITLVRTSAL